MDDPQALAEQALFAERERALVTLRSISDAVISTDANARIEYLNPAAERLTGWPLEQSRGRFIAEVLNFIDEQTRTPVPNPLLVALGHAAGGDAADRAVLVTRDGAEIAIQESASLIHDRSGAVIGAVIVFHDVTRERRLKRALSYQASHDALTGLINRREFDNRLHAAVANAQHGIGDHALLFIDLDRFKQINDLCGHSAGDRLLREVTVLLQSHVRTSDVVARLGGDEFGVLLEDCELGRAMGIAENVRQAIHDFRFDCDGKMMSVGASLGVVAINKDVRSVVDVMTAADTACYAAKDGGRNQVHLHQNARGNVPDRDQPSSQ